MATTDDWARWLLGELVNDLVLHVTSETVYNADQIALAHAKQIGHLRMQDAVSDIQKSGTLVLPTLQKARAALPVDAKSRLRINKCNSRPIQVEATTLLIDGERVTVRNASTFLDLYDLTWPYRDIKASVTPTTPPDLSSADKVYQFIGERVSDQIVYARAARLQTIAVSAIQSMN